MKQGSLYNNKNNNEIIYYEYVGSTATKLTAEQQSVDTINYTTD
jgi:hypothetical protein